MSWKRALLLGVFIALAIVVVLAGAVYMFVHTKAFNRLVLAKLIQGAEAPTGAPVEIEGLAIHWVNWINPDADLYGIAMYGNGGVSQPPVFQAEHVRVGIRIASLFRREIDLEEIVLDRPVVDFRVDVEGRTNLPHPPPKNKSADLTGTLFNLAIRHVAVNSGRIYYNDRNIPLSAELHDFSAQVKFDAPSEAYQGALGYRRGHVVAERFYSFEHGAQLRFVASRSALEMDPLVLSAGKSRVRVRAKLLDYAEPRIQGSYEALFDTEEIGTVLKTSSLPVGLVALAGTLRYQSAAKGSFLDGVYLNGNIRSARLLLESRPRAVSATSLRGNYTLQNGNIGLRNMEADLLGGHLMADGDIRSFGARPSSRLSVTWKGVSFQDANATLASGSYSRLRLAGRADLDARASWSRSVDDLKGHLLVKIYGPRTSASDSEIPLNGILDITYDAARDTASFRRSCLATGNTDICLAGALSKDSHLTVQANTSNLHEVSLLASQIASAVNPAKPSGSSPPVPPGLEGSAHFNGQVSGSVKNPRLQGELLARNVQVDGAHWSSIQSGVDLSPQEVTLSNGLVNSPSGQLTFRVRAGLRNWSFARSNPVAVDATAVKMQVADLLRLARLHYPVSGTLSGRLSIQGSALSPSGYGSIRITKALAWNQPVDSLAIDFHGNGNLLQSKGELHAPAGNITADLSYDSRTEQYDVAVDTSAVKIEEIQAVRTYQSGLSGVLSASARGRGSIHDPRISVSVKVAEPQVHGQLIPEVEGEVNIAHEHANFMMQSNIDHRNVFANGDVALTGAYNTTVSVDMGAFPIGALLSSYLEKGPPRLSGQARIHAELRGPLKDTALIQASLEIPEMNLAYESNQILLVQPLRVDYRQGTVTLERTELKGAGGDLTLQGVIPIQSAAVFHIGANGTVDLGMLRGFTKGVKGSGRIGVNLSVSGALTHPALQGEVLLENAAVSSDSIPVSFEGVNGKLNFSGDRIEIGRMTGTVGGGNVSAQGFLTYGAQPSFDLGLYATSVRVRYPEGLRSMLNCDLRLKGTADSTVLSGRVLVDQVSFTQQFDLVNFVNELSSELAPSPPPFEKNVKLNVSLQSEQGLRLANSQLSVQGAADLNLTGTLASPIVLGRATLSGGELFFWGNRYEMQSGTLEFSNPVRLIPIINVFATTRVDQYNITINFAGPIDRLRMNYTSDPALPPSDIINLIAFGKTAEDARSSPTPATLGAQSVLAQGVTSQISGRIQKLAGISQLSINPLIGNNQQNPGAQIALQQRVTGNILLIVTTDTTETQATTAQVQYRISRGASVSALRDQNGGYAVDIHLHKSF